MSSIRARLETVRQRISLAEQEFARTPGSVRLLAVSKTRPVSDLVAALTAGQQLFGESYVQEALPKIEALAGHDVEWHFIGGIQSNKTQDIAANFDWVHSVDRVKIAQRLNDQRPAHLPRLQLCLAVNISGEKSKSGTDPGQVAELAAAVAALPRLQLRGLMVIPAVCNTFERQREPFRALRRLLEDLRARGFDLDTLSMGMSGDMEAAIAEGATIVRIGTDVFGPRP